MLCAYLPIAAGVIMDDLYCILGLHHCSEIVRYSLYLHRWWKHLRLGGGGGHMTTAARGVGKFSQLEALKSILRPLLDQNLLLYCHCPNLKTGYSLILKSLASPCVLQVAD